MKFDFEKLDKTLTFDMIHKISNQFKLIRNNNIIKWANRNAFIYYLYPEIYKVIEDLICLSRVTINIYQPLYIAVSKA